MRHFLFAAWPGSKAVRMFFTLTILLIIPASTMASLIAYEGFEYDAGVTLTNQNGGYGWGPAWSATAAGVPATNRLYSLTYNGLFVSGNHLLDGYADPNGNVVWPTSGGQTVSVQRQLVNTQALGEVVGGSGGTVWLSFLCQNYNTTTGGLLGYRETKLALFSGATTNGNGTANVSGSERLDIGVPNTYAAGAADEYAIWSGSSYALSGVATVRGAQYLGTDATYLLVRIDLDGTTANDTASLWVNPNISLGEGGLGTAQSVFTGINLDWINGFRFQAGNASGGNGTNATWAVDEFRMGTSYSDLAPVPEPSVITIMGVALSGLWLSIRRRK